MAATTWDPNNKAAGITLSSGNLVALAASGTNPGVFATRPITGKSYGEHTVTTIPGNFALGFANRSWNDASTTILGGDANGLAFRQDGTVKLNNANLTTIQTYAVGNVVQFAIDPFAALVWFNVNNGSWNNSGAANPATGVGGIDYSSMSYGSLLPAFGAVTTTSKVTTVFSSGGWTYPAPSGFSSVDAVGASGVAADLLSATAPYLGAARQDPLTGSFQRVSINQAGWGPNGSTNVSGTVTESGSPVAKIVRIYDRASGKFLGQTTSSAIDGTYSIPAFGHAPVVAVAFDDPTYNALVFDEVIPA